MKLAVLRNCDVAPRLREGRVHLRFSLGLARTQLLSQRHAHCENPLTSTAWREPSATQEFSSPSWLWTRLDQCATGLVGPQGDLHLMPTLIRTTSAAMKAALSLRCSADHPHELVQGAATAASAMYSPRLARLVANVIHPTSPPSVSKIGGGEDKTVPFFVKGLGWVRRTRRDSRPDSNPGISPLRNWEVSHISSRGLTLRALQGRKPVEHAGSTCSS